MLTALREVIHCGQNKEHLPLRGKQKDVGVSRNPIPQGLTDFAKILNATMNLSLSPCNDFYNYVCGKEMLSTYQEIALELQKKLALGMKRSLKIPVLTKLDALLDKCVNKSQNVDDYNGVKFLKTHYQKFSSILGTEFPILLDGPIKKPTKEQLTEAMFFFSSISRKTLTTAKVDYSYRQNEADPVMTINFKSPSLLLSTAYYYYDKLWDNQVAMDPVFNIIARPAHRFISAASVQVAKEKLRKDIQDVMKLEKLIVDRVLPNPQMASLFVKEEADDLKAHVLSNNFKIRIYAPESLMAMKNLIDSDEVDGRTLVNYLYLHLLRAYETRLPPAGVSRTESLTFNDDSSFEKLHSFVNSKTEGSEMQQKELCLGNMMQTDALTETFGYLSPLIERLYAEGSLPTPEIRQKKVEYVSQLTRNLLQAFRTQLDELDWTTNSKSHAYEKLENIELNLVYPEKLFNDTYLNAKYASYELNPTLSYEDELERAQELAFKDRKRLLLQTVKDRKDMYLPIYTVNAFNNPPVNAIIIEDGLLSMPIFSVDYPTAAAYGGAGSLVGHEIVHGYDNLGIRFDKTGDMKEWMDQETKQKFNTMAQCVVNQFNGFTTSHNSSVNGHATQGENIADAGGLLAAYRAYKAQTASAGADPPIPLERLQSLTNDQIFFISFALFHCQKPPILMEVLATDMHAESKLRVLGVLQSMPEFKEAFKCNVGDLYAPKEHCNVYRKAPSDKPC
uniref:Neprilysin-2 n=1 Tax=Bursaphelenchus xylophilus TaxID=6326 RepID=A0A1I7S2U5_BURXY